MMHEDARQARRGFLAQGLTVGTALATGLAVARGAAAQEVSRSGKPGARDIAVLKFLAAAELVEADLWRQYQELARNNRNFRAALLDIDDGLADYAIDTQDDEESHARFINAYLRSIGEAPVDLDPFRTLVPPAVTGLRPVGRLTNLTALTVDTSYYTRYRSPLNPDLGGSFPQIARIVGQPAIPLTNALNARRLSGIAQTAAFHFAAIEQGGTSLYDQFTPIVSHPEVRQIVSSIYATEAIHYATFRQSLEGIRGFASEDGRLVIPNLTEGRHESRRVMPRPCAFLRADLPDCSVIRPSSPAKAGARAAAGGLVASGLFKGQPPAFLAAVVALATAADGAA
ncbi:MAG: ferritin-like domain-containing protein [Geminicoccaceae bacterium]